MMRSSLGHSGKIDLSLLFSAPYQSHQTDHHDGWQPPNSRSTATTVLPQQWLLPALAIRAVYCRLGKQVIIVVAPSFIDHSLLRHGKYVRACTSNTTINLFGNAKDVASRCKTISGNVYRWTRRNNQRRQESDNWDDDNNNRYNIRQCNNQPWQFNK